jgi:hypothetical protein
MITLTIGTTSTYAEIDPTVLTEKVENVYVASPNAKAIIENIRFSDVSSSFWAIEPITRFGALEIVKGYNEDNAKKYRPNVAITNEEALAFILRALGLEEDVQKAAANIEKNPDSPEHVLRLWSKGYLQIANNLNLITEDDLDSAFVEEQEGLDPNENFIRRGYVTREQLAVWLVKAINRQQPNLLAPVYKQQEIFNYSDWEEINGDYIPYVESIIKNQIIVGSNKKFNPKGNVTRAMMAQIFKNLDNIIYTTMNITKSNGIVSHIEDSNIMGASNSKANRRILIRDENGLVNEVNFEYNRNSIDKIFTKDVPVLVNGSVGGLLTLREGEYIEYLVDNETNEMLYVYSKGLDKSYKLEGTLQPLKELDNGKITIKNDKAVSFTYQMIGSLYDKVKETILINDLMIKKDDAPISKKVILTINNNLVTQIDYIGNEIMYNEISGIVKENVPLLGYITIITWDGKEITKKYIKKNVKAEKQHYYDNEDEIGYIDEVFPDYRFDPRDSKIEDIEAGDIVHIRLDVDNEYVYSISAKTNYIVKYGIIKQVVNNGINGLRLRVELSDGSSRIYNINSNVPVKRADKVVWQNELKEGQVIKMLVNQAVFEPGTITETIKEILIDEYGNEVTNIYRGSLGKLNNAQRTLTILNSYELTKAGWRDYSRAKVLDVSNKNIKYYNNSKQISLDYAMNNLTYDGMQVYVAMEKYYDKEKVVKVTFRDGRDSVLSQDNIIYSNGNNIFKILQRPNNINTDDGTIVVKNGKLVEDNNIVSPDYAQVILNGYNRAAVVNITPEPSNAATSIFRGRIKNIDENEQMEVQSFALLRDMKWIYSPIPRLFTIDYETIIIDENGIVSQKDFIDYSEKTKVDNVYTIISDGTKAKYVVENPYCIDGVKGEIYEIANDNIKIKDTIVLNKNTNTWRDLSYSNSYADIKLQNNSIIIKNNEVISYDELEKGDVIKVLTNEYLINKLALNKSREVNGYIILVEK